MNRNEINTVWFRETWPFFSGSFLVTWPPNEIIFFILCHWRARQLTSVSACRGYPGGIFRPFRRKPRFVSGVEQSTWRFYVGAGCAFARRRNRIYYLVRRVRSGGRVCRVLNRIRLDNNRTRLVTFTGEIFCRTCHWY